MSAKCKAPARRTQAERRANTRAAVLASACRLFGRKGYANTSLEEVAAESGTTIRPIYHYFGNKLELFAAANAGMEERIVATLQYREESEPEARALESWRAFLKLCRDPEFRQIVLVDAPALLGRERWRDSAVTRTAAALVGVSSIDDRNELSARMLLAALAEAALSIGESSDPEAFGQQTEGIVARFARAIEEDDTP